MNNTDGKSSFSVEALLAKTQRLETALGNSPFFIGTVVRLNRQPVNEFNVGTKVRVNLSSKFYTRFPGKLGVIIKFKDDEPGWAYVRFPEGPETSKDSELTDLNRFRIGGNEVENFCDLDVEQSAVVLLNSQMIEVSITGLDVKVGSTIKLNKEYKVIDVGEPLLSGVIAFVRKVVDGGLVEVDTNGGRKMVFVGDFAGKLEESDRVILNSTETVIVKNLGLEDGEFSVVKETGVSWDDIVGQEDARRQIGEVIDGIVRKPGHFAYFKKKKPAGFTLFGPPGCSKTMICKAVFTQVEKVWKEAGVKDTSGGFILLSGPEILDKFVGVAEAALRHAFKRASKFKARTGFPAILVIDEAEAILSARGSGISSDVNNTIVPTYLAQVQGVKESDAIVILATNRPEILDSAVTRRGRTVMIEIKRPDKEAAKQIVLKNLVGVPVSETTTEELAQTVVDEFFDQKHKLFEVRCVGSDGKEHSEFFTLANIANGATFASIVEDDMKRTALSRVIENPEPSGGIRKEDAVLAVQNYFKQSFALNHEEALAGFTKSINDRVIGITKLHQVQA